MPDCQNRILEAERLRERITSLEDDRSDLMASIRHMRRGQLADCYLTDPLRAELARASSYGVLLETIEVEIRCLRQRLRELESSENAAQGQDAPARDALRHWRELDRRLKAREFDTDEVVRVAIKSGLTRRVAGPGPPNALREVWVIEPEPSRHLVPGPLVLLDYRTDAFGGPRIYRPIGDERRWSTEIFP